MAPASSPIYHPDTVVLMRRAVQGVWDQVAAEYEDVELRLILAARERVATIVLFYVRMGIRDPLVLRAMGLGAAKRSMKD